MAAKPLSILSLPVGRDACSFYRIRKPFEALTQAGALAHVVDAHEDNMEEVVRALPFVDVLFMRPGSEVGLEKIKKVPEFANLKAKIVIDIDDNYDEISPLSQFYQEYGLTEVTLNGKTMGNDGKSGFSIQNNLKRVTDLKWALKHADLVTVTTEKLAEHARKYNDSVYVHDNTIDFRHWWKLNNKLNTPLKVVWQGSPSHYEDWYAIKEPLNRLMKEFDFELYMLGSNYIGIFDESVRQRVHTLPWVPFEAHSYRMMSLQADLAIIPLDTQPFNQYKSSIKWYEMSAMAVPSVVSRVTPYAHSLIEGKTALGYSSPEEFYTACKTLLSNKGLRSNIGNAAYQWVRKHKDLHAEGKRLLETLEELCKS